MSPLPVQSNVKVHIFFAFICRSQILLSVLKACNFRVLSVFICERAFHLWCIGCNVSTIEALLLNFHFP